MESIQSSKPVGQKNQKMTLKGYVESLPPRRSPRWEFVKKVASDLGVEIATVRNWVYYGMKPRNYEHILYLSEVTGIPAEELWED